MRKNLVIILSLMLLLAGCGKTQTGPSWQDQYDLGVRYLSEGNYEEAIIAFAAAIEIDPKRADAYIGLAESYIVQNNFDEAKAILQTGYDLTGSEDIKMRLEELESGSFTDFLGRVRKLSHYDSNGSLTSYIVTFYEIDGSTTAYSYNSSDELISYELREFVNQQESVTMYEPDGTVQWKEVTEYNDNGQPVETSFYDYIDDHVYMTRTGYEYDSEGRQTKILNYDENGRLYGYSVLEHDENGYLLKSNAYSETEGYQGCIVYEHDEDGNIIRQTFYDENGIEEGYSLWDSNS